MSRDYRFEPVDAIEYGLRWPPSAMPNGGVRSMKESDGGRRRLIQVRLQGARYAAADGPRGDALFVLDRRTARLLARRILAALEGK